MQIYLQLLICSGLHRELTHLFQSVDELSQFEPHPVFADANTPLSLARREARGEV